MKLIMIVIYPQQPTTNDDVISDKSFLSTDSDDSIDDDSNNENGNPNIKNLENVKNRYDKIHPNLNTTLEELLVMVLMIFLKHNLTWVAVENLLFLLKMVCQSEIIPTSKYLFFKVFKINFKR